MKRVFSIGRDPSCDIVLYDPNQVVSRNHATLRVDGNKFFITDHSTNGTYRNGIRLTPNVEYRITRDDDVSFGEILNLDWGSVPGIRKSGFHFWPYLLVGLLAIALVACLLWYLSKSRQSAPNGNYSVPPSVQVDSSAFVNTPDSLVTLENVNKPKNKAKPKGNVKPKGDVKKESVQPAASPSLSKKNMDQYSDEDDVRDVDAL